MPAYIGVGGVARKAAQIYIGVNGVARKVTNGYIGVGGVARRFHTVYPTWSVNNLTYAGNVSALSSMATINFVPAGYGNSVFAVGGLSGTPILRISYQPGVWSAYQNVNGITGANNGVAYQDLNTIVAGYDPGNGTVSPACYYLAGGSTWTLATSSQDGRGANYIRRHPTKSEFAVATRVGSGNLTIYNLNGTSIGTVRQIYTGPNVLNDGFLAIDYSGNGNYFASFQQNGIFNVYDSSTSAYNLLYSYPLNDYCNTISFGSDGNYLAMSSTGTAYLYYRVTNGYILGKSFTSGTWSGGGIRDFRLLPTLINGDVHVVIAKQYQIHFGIVNSDYTISIYQTITSSNTLMDCGFGGGFSADGLRYAIPINYGYYWVFDAIVG